MAVNVIVTLRGNKYEVSANTVSEIQKQIEEKAGLSSVQQAVLYKGKILEAEDALSEVGIADGDTLNIVPNRRPKSARPLTDSIPSAFSENTNVQIGSESATSGLPTNGLDGLFGSGGPGMGLEDLAGMTREQYEEMVDKMYDSDMMSQLFNDPEQLEMTRKAILENPMMKQMMESLPGFQDIINDPESWKNAMLQAKEMMEAQRQARALSKKNKEIEDFPEDEN